MVEVKGILWCPWTGYVCLPDASTGQRASAGKLRMLVTIWFVVPLVLGMLMKEGCRVESDGEDGGEIKGRYAGQRLLFGFLDDGCPAQSLTAYETGREWDPDAV